MHSTGLKVDSSRYHIWLGRRYLDTLLQLAVLSKCQTCPTCLRAADQLIPACMSRQQAAQYVIDSGLNTCCTADQMYLKDSDIKLDCGRCGLR